MPAEPAATLSADLGRRPLQSPARRWRGREDMTLFLELLGVAALILLNAFFVAGEYALVTARRTKIQELADEGNRRARAVQRIVADPPRFIAAMPPGVTLTSLGIGALGEQALARALDPVVATLLVVVNGFLTISYVHGVADVMVPRPEVVALSIDLPPEECLAAVIESPYTRYPVYRETLDDIVGVLHVRDLFSALNDQGFANIRIEELLRDAYIVPETKDLAALLADFRRTNFHMAVVVDEYGTMAGIVTLEDLLEEIVGEIEDEFDLPDESVEHVDDKTIRIDGTYPIDDFNEKFQVELPIEDYHTVAGFVFGLLGRAAAAGDEVEYDGLRFRVIEIEGSRIEKLEVQFVEPPRDLSDDEPQEERAAAEG